MGIMDQALKLTQTLMDEGVIGRIPLENAKATMAPEKKNRTPEMKIVGRDREGHPFEMTVHFPGVGRDKVEEMARSINRHGRTELQAAVFQGMTVPRFAAREISTQDAHLKVPQTPMGGTYRDAGRLARRSREVLRDEMIGKRRLGGFDRALVQAAAHVGETLHEYGRRDQVSMERMGAKKLLKGPGSVEGIPLAAQMRLAAGRGNSR